MPLLPEDILKLVLAVVAGGLIGLEREYRDKAAGFRTVIFICLGSALFTIFSTKLGGDTRIAANIVTGVGFLGAGAILRDGGRVVGLTTAATIWLAAALGIGIGGGYYLLTGIATLIILIVLWVFPRFESRVDRVRESRTYEVTSTLGGEALTTLEKLLVEAGLRVTNHQRAKRGDAMVFTWETSGTPEAHDRAAAKLCGHAGVTEFKA